MKKFPIGIQNFREIAQENYLYIDKTKQIYNLIMEGKVYFLSEYESQNQSYYKMIMFEKEESGDWVKSYFAISEVEETNQMEDFLRKARDPLRTTIFQ